LHLVIKFLSGCLVPILHLCKKVKDHIRKHLEAKLLYRHLPKKIQLKRNWETYRELFLCCKWKFKNLILQFFCLKSIKSNLFIQMISYLLNKCFIKKITVLRSFLEILIFFLINKAKLNFSSKIWLQSLHSSTEPLGDLIHSLCSILSCNLAILAFLSNLICTWLILRLLIISVIFCKID